MTDKPQESAEQAAKKYAEKFNPHSLEHTRRYLDFLNGAEWQKAKDAATIAKLRKELVSIKKYCDSCGPDALPESDISKSISKALEASE
jgi:hypothetical protein